jgi:predicted TIM-barrel fold metal-dependent hydrolase
MLPNFWLIAALMLAVAAHDDRTASPKLADLVPDFERYVASDAWRVDRGTVRVLTFSEVATSIIIETEQAPGTSVVLTAPDRRGKLTAIDMKRYYAEQKSTTIRGDGGSVKLPIPSDGAAWYLILHPYQFIDLLKYKPVPVLKVPQTAILRAKYPVVDVHADLDKDPKATAESRLAVMDATGIAIAVNGTKYARGDTERSYRVFEAQAPNRFVTFAPVNFSDYGDPGFSARAVAQLEADHKKFHIAGIAEMVDKGPGINEVTFFPRKTHEVRFDGDALSPLWQAAARLRVPILLHVADPAGSYQEPARAEDPLPGAVAPEYILYGVPVPSRDEMLDRRDRLLERFPGLTIISAHIDNCTENLAEIGERLRKHPNLYMEIGVRYPELARQPRTARAFLTEFQDRILYGGDSLQTVDDYRVQFRIFETEDDAITRPFDRNSIWPSYGLGLPNTVLKKLYYANAARIIPGVKKRLLAMFPDLDFPE